MTSYPTLRRLLAGICTFVVFAGVWFLVSSSARSPNVPPPRADQTRTAQAAWPMFGGSLNRNMVNTFDKGIPTEWSVEEGSRKNIKWVAELGSKAYGGPIVAAGKVFI